MFSLRILLGCLSRKSLAEAVVELVVARVGPVAAGPAAKAALEAQAVLVERAALAEQAAKVVPVARERQEGLAEARPDVPAEDPS